MIRYINEDSFNNEVLNKKNAVIVNFFATWCGPCMKLGNELEQLSSSRSGYEILKLDVDKCPNLVKKYGIDVVPIIMIFNSGQLVEKQIGYMDKNNIQEIMEKYP